MCIHYPKLINMSMKETVEIQDVNYMQLSQELALLEHDCPDCEVLSVLREGRDITSYKNSLTNDMKELERGVIDNLLANTNSLLSLYKETQMCDSILSSMENTLETFSNSLRGVSDDIRQLQHKSEELSNQLKSRSETQGKLIEFIDSVIVSPDLVSVISDEEDCGSDKYLAAIEQLIRKLRSHAALPQDLPAVADSAPELQKLKSRAIVRVRDFLIAKINTLKQPRTNMQIIQRNVLVKLKSLVKFLREIDNGIHYKEMVEFYASTLSKLYLNQFKTYVQTLSKLQLEATATKTDLLGTIEGQASAPGGAVDLVNNMLKLSTGGTSSMSIKGNVFSLSGGRDRVIKEDLESEAIIVVTEAPVLKYYPEALLRSHQKLLADAASSEHLFLLEFFLLDPAAPSNVFDAVLGKTTTWFTEYIIGTHVKESFDPVGLMLSVRVIEFLQDLMANKRKIIVLDTYFENLLSQIRQRLRYTIDQNTDSLKRIEVKKLTIASPVTPFYITRRYAEFSASILFIKSEMINEDSLITSEIDLMVSAFDQFLSQLSKRFSTPAEQTLCVLNNVDLILSVYQERGLAATISTKSKVTQKYTDEMAAKVSVFMEQRLVGHFGPLIKFTIDQEKQLSSASAADGKLTSEMERLVASFQQNWKLEIGKIQKEIFDSFSNFATASEILKNSMTQLLLYYTRFQKVVTARLAGAQPPWVRQIVPSAVIMAEIKQVSSAGFK